MKRFLLSIIVAALALAACVPLTTPTVAPIQVTVSTATPTPADGPQLLLLPGARVVTRSASYTLIAADPAKAMAAIETAIEKTGGYVTSASSSSAGTSSAYASLSGRIPPDQLAALREVILSAADSVQYQSLYLSDVTSDYRAQLEREDDLMRAREQIWHLMATASDPTSERSYRIMLELIDADEKNVQYQLDSYAQQAALASVDVTINQMAAPVISE